ncbi:hypothetical protein CISIN_1g0455771mg, partial [Citrus sinensis]
MDCIRQFSGETTIISLFLFSLSSGSDETEVRDILLAPSTLWGGNSLIPGNSSQSFLVISYKNLPPLVIWVANRNGSINSNLSQDNDLGIIWNVILPRATGSPALQLLVAGNLVLREFSLSHSEGYLWESFDSPSDTILPGMKRGMNLRTGWNQNIKAWNLEKSDTPQLVLWRRTEKVFRSWNGISGGCKRNWEADCGDGEVFLMFEGIKLPDKSEFTCEFECSKYSS